MKLGNLRTFIWFIEKWIVIEYTMFCQLQKDQNMNVSDVRLECVKLESSVSEMWSMWRRIMINDNCCVRSWILRHWNVKALWWARQTMNSETGKEGNTTMWRLADNRECCAAELQRNNSSIINRGTMQESIHISARWCVTVKRKRVSGNRGSWKVDNTGY